MTHSEQFEFRDGERCWFVIAASVSIKQLTASYIGHTTQSSWNVNSLPRFILLPWELMIKTKRESERINQHQYFVCTHNSFDSSSTSLYIQFLIVSSGKWNGEEHSSRYYTPHDACQPYHRLLKTLDYRLVKVVNCTYIVYVQFVWTCLIRGGTHSSAVVLNGQSSRSF